MRARLFTLFSVALMSSLTGLGFDGYLPHVAHGEAVGLSMRTTFVVLNPSTSADVDVTVSLTDDGGDPMVVTIPELSSSAGSTFTFRLLPGETRLASTSGPGPLKTGAAAVHSSGNIAVQAVFSVSSGGAWVTEAGVGASETVTSFVVPADCRGDFATGLALFNFNGTQQAQLSIRLFDEAGEAVGDPIGLALSPLEHRARFLVGPGEFFPQLSTFRGTVRVTSTLPVAAMALRQHSGPLSFTSLPVTSSGSSRTSFRLPQLASGTYTDGSFGTSLILFNLSDSNTADADITLTDDRGNPLAAGIPGRVSLGPAACTFLETSRSANPLTTGAAVISSSRPIGVAAVFTNFDGQERFVTEAGVGHSETWQVTRFAVDMGGGLDTGLAVFNPGAGSNTVSVRLLDTSGQPIGSAKGFTLGPRSQLARYVTELFGAQGIFKGSLLVNASAPLASLALRQSFTPYVLTTLPSTEGAPEVVSGSHAGRFTSFEGTQTCLPCHRQHALEVHGSLHYQWKGDTRYAPNLNGDPSSKLGGINDFCIYPDINWIGKMVNLDGKTVDGGCARCHAGLGLKPTPDATDAQLENIDCLVCHSPSYLRRVEQVQGAFRFVPDPERMAVSTLQAAVDLRRPTNDACLNCHATSGGGNNLKRGDIEEAHRDPSPDFDVHLARSERDGAGLQCINCHIVSSHRFAGRGSDMRAVDGQSRVSCASCHLASPHSTSLLNQHARKVDCTVCHIPTFAKIAPTDMDRDYSQPAEIDPDKRLYEPFMTRLQNVVPEYLFFNGTSAFYQFGTAAVSASGGRVVMSTPLGAVNDPDSKLHAFKHHTGKQPVDPVTGRLLPLNMGIYFQTGDLTSAVRQGVQAVGWDDNGFNFAATERYLGIFHEVAPKSQAVTCDSCHGSGNRIDFAGLGYTPLQTRNGKALCVSCHGDKSDEWSAAEYFTKVHQKHVDDKRLDCSNCHSFTRQ